MAFKIVTIKKEELEFSYKINIDKEGIFTAYLPEEITKLFDAAGMVLKKNPARQSRIGFYSAAKMCDLKNEITEVVEEYFSRELSESKKVIRYDIQTTCSYCLNIHGEIVPNGSREWVLSDTYDWKQGTVQQNATNRNPYGILVYAEPFKKQVYKYKSGKEKIEYNQIFTNGMSEDDFLYHLASFCSMCPPDRWEDSNLKEIDATPAAATFFVELLTSICRLNENIKEKLDPKSILKLIASKQKLLT
jgi:hypothetical protein